MRRLAGEIVLKFTGLLLLTAAMLKGYQLITEPVANTDLWSNRNFLIFTVEFELAMGIWLISGVFRRIAWLPVLRCLICMFFCFTFVSMPCPVLAASDSEKDQLVNFRKLYGDELREAYKARDNAQLLLNKFKTNYQWSKRTAQNPSSPAALSDSKEVIEAYKAITSKFQGTEIGAKAEIYLGGLYTYMRDHDSAIATVKEASRRYAGTPVENEFYFSLGQMYLQGKKDPKEASAWFKLIPKPTDDDSIKPESYNETEKDYMSAQQQIAKCELELNKFEYAKRRYERLIERYPFYKPQISRMLKTASDLALAKTLGNDISENVEDILKPDPDFKGLSFNTKKIENASRPLNTDIEQHIKSDEDLSEKVEEKLKPQAKSTIDKSDSMPGRMKIIPLLIITAGAVLILTAVCFFIVSVKKGK